MRMGVKAVIGTSKSSTSDILCCTAEQNSHTDPNTYCRKISGIRRHVNDETVQDTVRLFLALKLLHDVFHMHDRLSVEFHILDMRCPALL